MTHCIKRLLVTYLTAPVLRYRPLVVPHKLRIRVFLRTTRRA